jgi:hypothetical protein
MIIMSKWDWSTCRFVNELELANETQNREPKEDGWPCGLSVRFGWHPEVHEPLAALGVSRCE